MPTFAGGNPGGSESATLEAFLESAIFLEFADAFAGETTADDATFNLVAESFDGAMTSHLLVRFAGFPDTVIVDNSPNEIFEYVSGRVIGVVTDSLGTTPERVTLRLWSLEQPWDSVAVSWENAVDRPGEQVAWQVPGGTVGQSLSTIDWFRGQIDENEESVDSLYWTISGEAVSRLARGESFGLMVSVATEGGRAIIGDLTLEASIVAESHPDTVVTRTIFGDFHPFIHTPELTVPGNVLRVGGLTSDRSMMRLSLDLSLPDCVPPVGPGCAQVLPADVSLNRVELLLDPVPVTQGYRPVGPTRISLWRLAEPELGIRAPLASTIDVRLVTDSVFTPEGAEPVMFDVTSAVSGALLRGETELGLALMVEPEASTFGTAWFTMSPRLRFVYSRPPTPQLP